MKALTSLSTLLLAFPLSAGATVLFSENFDGGGVNSVFNYTKSDPAPIADPGTFDVGGANGNVARITHLSGGNNNSIAWDSVAIASTPALRLSFDFNITDDAANAANGGCCGQAADGFGIGFFPNALYGATGGVNPAAGPVAFAWERPAPASVPALVLGFDIFDSDGANPGLDGNNVTLNWNGAQLGDAIVGFTINDNAWHRAVLTITAVGGDSTLDLTIDGNLIHSGVLATGVDLDGVADNYRLIAGGRTGGAIAQVQLDNILLEAIPEPSMALLALAGLGIVATRRRRIA